MATTNHLLNSQGIDTRTFVLTFSGATVDSGPVQHGLQFAPYFASWTQVDTPTLGASGAACALGITFNADGTFNALMSEAVAAGTATFRVTVGRIPGTEGAQLPV